MKAEPTTLRKLSELLGLSISTVSRALKNHPDISEATKKKVWELSAELDYEPNTYAVNLRTNQSKLFGVIVPSISSYFYNFFLASLEEEVKKQGYSLLILQSGDDPVMELFNLKVCKENRVAGIFASLTSETKDISAFLKLAEHSIPVLFFDKVPTWEPCLKVCLADEQAARLAAQALIAQKKQRVLALFGHHNMSISMIRRQAFLDELESQGVAYKALEVTSQTHAYQQTYQMLTSDASFDTIFSMSDEILLGVLKAVQQSGIQVPTQVGIIAISDGTIPQNYYPEVSYVETSGRKLGKQAIAAMFECMHYGLTAQQWMVESVYVSGGTL
ncbi:LacI family DNA-binding transcriptional regulator [Siphonobacter sp. SORGH_AS_1065]|uniref:LacI family DNA-binding transcriptional regulator n=1 Tax=Siphonobacter sp. SORGH_AS_1065 TaxID=3041795 RepID=UPI00278A9101|nr:LacI family DNA-binding transcriptional regulator [Siphonobacter sp. SORGH_AS_1065]MDQ1087619.1 LacI family transcriptional regulator [Siphonobacter sp. SORGH_AS_1065]